MNKTATVRLTEQQHAQFLKLGGSDWLRKQIDAHTPTLYRGLTDKGIESLKNVLANHLKPGEIQDPQSWMDFIMQRLDDSVILQLPSDCTLSGRDIEIEFDRDEWCGVPY